MHTIARSLRTLLALSLLAWGLLIVALSPAASGDATAAPPPPRVAPDSSSPFGIAGAMRWPDWGSFSRPADAVLDTGAAWVREDFVWGLIEPKENQFDFTATDRIAGALAERKINLLGIISYAANWATPTKDDDGSASPVSFYNPDPGKYYAFVRALVSRYKGSVHYWEVWNEPDSALFWRPSPDVNQYATVLKTAYRAIKDADPTAKVLNGGLAGNAVPFLEGLVAAGAGSSFDVLSIHPYAIPVNMSQGRTESRPEVHKMVDVELDKYRAFLQRHGFNKPIWVTEVGWPAHDWGLDENTQADYLAQTYAQMLASGLAEKVFAYSFKDDSTQPGDGWGLIAWGGGKMDLSTRRPAFSAYATSALMLTGTKPAGRIQLGAYATVDGFELPGDGQWARNTNPNGSFVLTTEQKHTGASSGKLQYSFTGPNQAVDFAPPQQRPLPGNPTRLGLWVLGDASGDYLSVWLKDKDGELFKLRMGAVTGAGDGWRYYEASLNSYYFDWEKAGGSPANGKIDYPVSFVSFRLENTPDEPAGSGTIYVDDLQSFDGPDASAVRFTRSDGQVVDVLWSVNPVQVNLPTHSTTAQVTARDGAVSQVPAVSGSVPLRVSSSPIYVVHRVGDLPPGQDTVYAGAAQSGNGSAAQAICSARVRVPAGSDPGVLYFPETGHNLSGGFRTYWEANGGINLFGYPVTEEFSGPLADGKIYKQQYFERARLEWHPDSPPPSDIQLGLLGVWAAQSQGRNFARAQQSPGTTFFQETGHSLNIFKDWWTARGGLRVFGFPLSEEAQEKSAADGKTYTVQYFERNRLEYHPEYKGTDKEVLLGLLGAEYLSQSCGK